MGMCQRRKKMHSGDTHLARRWRVRNRRRDLDQVDNDLHQSEELINQAVDLEKPGFAQHYCVHCAKYFINDQAMQAHFRTKVHKRRLKALETEPYSIEESERAAGQGSFKQPRKRVMSTQPTKEEVASGKRIEIKEKTEAMEEDSRPAKRRKQQKTEKEDSIGSSKKRKLQKKGVSDDEMDS